MGWTSPEVLTSGRHSFSRSGLFEAVLNSNGVSDVYSFGVLMFEVTSYGKAPWGLATPAEIRTEVCSGNVLPQPAGCPQRLYRYMKRAWLFKPELRPSLPDMYAALLTQRTGNSDPASLATKLRRSQLTPLQELSPGRELCRSKVDQRLVEVRTFSGNVDLGALETEVNLLQTLRHANLLMFLGHSLKSSPPSMFFEWAGQGSLDKYLAMNELEQGELQQLGVGVARGMEYLAARRVLHRRLNSRVVYVNEGGIAKIGGFAHMKLAGAESSYLSRSSIGEIDRSCAPEVFREREFSKASDVYSLGVVLFEVAHGGTSPFAAFSDSEFLTMISAQSLTVVCEPSCLDKELYGVAAQCLVFSPADRPTAASVANALSDIKSGTERWEYYGELQFIRELGAGQYGTVVQMVARDLPEKGIDSVVAVKSLHSDADEAVQEFKHEMLVA